MSNLHPTFPCQAARSLDLIPTRCRSLSLQETYVESGRVSSEPLSSAGRCYGSYFLLWARKGRHIACVGAHQMVPKFSVFTSWTCSLSTGESCSPRRVRETSSCLQHAARLLAMVGLHSEFLVLASSPLSASVSDAVAVNSERLVLTALDVHGRRRASHDHCQRHTCLGSEPSAASTVSTIIRAVSP